MKKIVFITSCLFVINGLLVAQKAENILDKAAAAYEKSNGIAASFAANIRMGNQGGSESFDAEIEMKGDMFRLFMPDMRIWYDGETQWTYLVRANEVNISTPSDDDVQQFNPMSVLRGYGKRFKASYIGESTSDRGKMADDVRLSSKGGGDIESVDMQIERGSSLPVRLMVVMINGASTAIRISKLTTGVNQTDKAFKFDAKDYPGVTEVDLR